MVSSNGDARILHYTTFQAAAQQAILADLVVHLLCQEDLPVEAPQEVHEYIYMLCTCVYPRAGMCQTHMKHQTHMKQISGQGGIGNGLLAKVQASFKHVEGMGRAVFKQS